MKKKNIIIICLMIISLQINAQLSYNNLQNSLLSNVDISSTDNNSTKKAPRHNQERKFFIGIMSSIDFYNYKYNDNLNTTETVGNSPCYHLGIKVQYNLNEKLSLRSGISYSKIQYKWTLDIFVAIDQSDPLPITNNYIIDRSYLLNIPLMVGYTIYSNKNFKLTPSLGYVLNYKIAEREYIYYPTYSKYSDYNDKIAYHSFQLNLGCEYMLGKNFLITLEPYVNYKFNNKNSGWVVYSPFIFGGIVSVNYKL